MATIIAGQWNIAKTKIAMSLHEWNYDDSD